MTPMPPNPNRDSVLPAVGRDDEPLPHAHRHCQRGKGDASIRRLVVLGAGGSPVPWRVLRSPWRTLMPLARGGQSKSRRLMREESVNLADCSSNVDGVSLVWAKNAPLSLGSWLRRCGVERMSFSRSRNNAPSGAVPSLHSPSERCGGVPFSPGKPRGCSRSDTPGISARASLCDL